MDAKVSNIFEYSVVPEFVFTTAFTMYLLLSTAAWTTHAATNPSNRITREKYVSAAN